MSKDRPRIVVNGASTPNGAAHSGHESGQGGTGGQVQKPLGPFARRLAANYWYLLNSVTPADIFAITRKLIDMAQDGNVAAAKLLFQHLRI
jgi:hypothetical protein